MIYLITGTPGTGKTSYALKMILDNKFDLFKDEEGLFRPMFSVNIPNVNKKVIPVNDILADDFVSKPLADNFEQGSVIFVDEASELYPNRSASSKIPVHVEGLNTLRHQGLTLILITQAPTMIDPFVRNLVGKHIHIERKQLGSKLYEWNRCVTSVNSQAKAEAYTQPYAPDKRTFELYHSSTKHIKFKKSVSWYYKVFPVLVIFLLAVTYFIFSSLGGLAGDAVESSVEDAQSVSAVGSSNEAVLPSSGSGDAKNRSLREADFIPVVMPREETAPLYDSVREVTDFPRAGGCVKSAKSCTCYSQQGSVLTLIDTATCTDWVDTGMPFNPYLDRSVTRAEIDYSQIPDGTRYPPIPATDSRGNVLVMAGKSPGNLMYDDLAKGRLN